MVREKERERERERGGGGQGMVMVVALHCEVLTNSSMFSMACLSLLT